MGYVTATSTGSGPVTLAEFLKALTPRSSTLVATDRLLNQIPPSLAVAFLVVDCPTMKRKWLLAMYAAGQTPAFK